MVASSRLVAKMVSVQALGCKVRSLFQSLMGQNPKQDPKFWQSGLGFGHFFFNLKATQLTLPN
jgi:hypothetical protein